MKERKTNPYIKPIVWAIALIALQVYLTRTYEWQNAKTFFSNLTDCFVIPGVLLSGVAAISWAGTFGTFDVITYGTRSFFGIFIRSLSEKLPAHFYDYRKQKEENGRHWLKHTLQIGLACLALSVIFFVVYSIL